MKRQDEDHERVCSLCRYSSAISGREEMLCSKKGIISPEYSCRAFIYDPLKRVPKRLPKVELPELPQI